MNNSSKRFVGSTVWPGKQWEYSHYIVETNTENPRCIRFNDRFAPFNDTLGPIYDLSGQIVGVVHVCLETTKDSKGAWLNGAKNYLLNIPRKVPTASYWAISVYDIKKRSLIETDTFPDRSSRDQIAVNDDGSVDILFGPENPVDSPRSNWIKTPSGRGWFAHLRLYRPTCSSLDELWVLQDIEEVKCINTLELTRKA